MTVHTESGQTEEGNDGWELPDLVLYMLGMKCQWEQLWQCSASSWEPKRKFRTRHMDFLPRT